MLVVRRRVRVGPLQIRKAIPGRPGGREIRIPVVIAAAAKKVATDALKDLLDRNSECGAIVDEGRVQGLPRRVHDAVTAYEKTHDRDLTEYREALRVGAGKAAEFKSLRFPPGTVTKYQTVEWDGFQLARYNESLLRNGGDGL